MENKNYTEVYICGKVYTLGGFEEAEYLQKVAAYVNTKASELRGQPGFLRLGTDYQNVLLELNLADDVFKTRRQVAAAEKRLSSQEKETYNVKHDLVAVQMKLDAMMEQLERRERELAAAREQLEAFEKELSASKQERETLKEQLTEQLAEAKNQLEETELELEIAKEELAASGVELEKAKKRISQMEESRNNRRR